MFFKLTLSVFVFNPVRKASLSKRIILGFHTFREMYFPVSAPVKAYIHFKQKAIGYMREKREYNENGAL